MHGDHEDDDHEDDDHEDDDHTVGHTHSHGDEHTHSHGNDDDEHSGEDVAAHGDDDHDEHVEGPFDLHIWLDPENSEAMAHMIADTLSETDVANAERYEDNAHELIHRIEDLTAEIASIVAPVRGRPFIVFHDGYRYFEDRSRMNAAGSAVAARSARPESGASGAFEKR